MTPEVKTLKLYDQSVIIPRDTYEVGVENFDFKVLSGSRILVTLFVESLEEGASIQFDALNSFTVDNKSQWENILSFSSNDTGYTKRVITDFNKFFRLKMTVTGGQVDCTLAVSVFDNALTTRIENAEIDVHLSHLDLPYRKHDSTRIGDGQYQAKLNEDGSFNVNIVNAPSENPEIVISTFNEAPSIPNGVETLIVGYTVPSGKRSKLQRIEFSGENIGTYNVYLNGNKMGQKHTWFNGPMHGEFSFVGTTEEGPELKAGDVIELKCFHVRPHPGSFSGRIQSIEIG
jgi:hypothetical protein